MNRSTSFYGLLRLSILCLASNSARLFASSSPLYLPSSIRVSHYDDVNTPEPRVYSGSQIYIDMGCAAVLVLVGGVFAGLTIALMGQDMVNLEVLASSGDARETQAKRVLRLLSRGKHWVLVTLLLGNVVVNEALPIVLDQSLGGGWMAIVGSTVLIVIFGEIIPQSLCVRYGLSIGASLCPFVLVLMFLFSPVAWPTAKLLDYLLGEDHGTLYKKAGLKTLITLHAPGPKASEILNNDEVTIIRSVLDLKDKSVSSIMTPIDYVFTLSRDAILDQATMDHVLSAGFSRIPIHAPGNKMDFEGMLLVKTLITYDPEDGMKVSDFALATLPETSPDTSCLDILNYFQEGQSHMVLVSSKPASPEGALGVVTLEDVIEELIGEEIIDESDVYVDNTLTLSIERPTNTNRLKHSSVVDSTVTRYGHAFSQQLRLQRVLSAGLSRGTADKAATPLPSNPAGNPKHTKFDKVKIKHLPGTEGQSSNSTQPETDVNDENTPLIGR